MNLQVLHGLEYMCIGYRKMVYALSKHDRDAELLNHILNNELCKQYQGMFNGSFDELGIDDEIEEVFTLLKYSPRKSENSGNTLNDFMDGLSYFTKGLLYIKNRAYDLGINGVKVKLPNGKIATLNITSSNTYAEKDINKLFYKVHEFRIEFIKALNSIR